MKDIEEMKAGRFSNESEIVNRAKISANNSKDVKDALRLYTRRTDEVNDIKKISQTNSEVLKRSEILLKASEGELQKAKDLVILREDKKLREQSISNQERNLIVHRKSLEELLLKSFSLQKNRIEFVKRIQ